MNPKQYTDDLAHIRSMMERSSRFLSLSGWAGILPGIYALIGLAIGYSRILKAIASGVYLEGIDRNSPLAVQMVLIAAAVLSLSLLSSWYFCMRKARHENQPTWTPAIRDMLIHFSIPLITGALIVGWIYQHEAWQMLSPVLLSFYGLALIQVSRYTVKSIFWLGLIEIGLSIPAGIPGMDIPVLALGFGVAHIGYGIRMFNPTRA